MTTDLALARVYRRGSAISLSRAPFHHLSANFSQLLFGLLSLWCSRNLWLLLRSFLGHLHTSKLFLSENLSQRFLSLSLIIYYFEFQSSLMVVMPHILGSIPSHVRISVRKLTCLKVFSDILLCCYLLGIFKSLLLVIILYLSSLRLRS